MYGVLLSCIIAVLLKPVRAQGLLGAQISYYLGDFFMTYKIKKILLCFLKHMTLFLQQQIYAVFRN